MGTWGHILWSLFFAATTTFAALWILTTGEVAHGDWPSRRKPCDPVKYKRTKHPVIYWTNVIILLIMMGLSIASLILGIWMLHAGEQLPPPHGPRR